MSFAQSPPADVIIIREISSRFVAELYLLIDHYCRYLHSFWIRRLNADTNASLTLWDCTVCQQVKRTHDFCGRAWIDKTHIVRPILEDLVISESLGRSGANLDTAIELFPAASYLYVLYGMGFWPERYQSTNVLLEQDQADRSIEQNQQIAGLMLWTLPSQRKYIQKWLANTT